MTSQNPTTISTTPQNDQARTDSEQPNIKRELTDEEMISVIGGAVGVFGGTVTSAPPHGNRPSTPGAPA